MDRNALQAAGAILVALVLCSLLLYYSGVLPTNSTEARNTDNGTKLNLGAINLGGGGGGGGWSSGGGGGGGGVDTPIDTNTTSGDLLIFADNQMQNKLGESVNSSLTWENMYPGVNRTMTLYLYSNVDYYNVTAYWYNIEPIEFQDFAEFNYTQVALPAFQLTPFTIFLHAHEDILNNSVMNITSFKFQIMVNAVGL